MTFTNFADRVGQPSRMACAFALRVIVEARREDRDPAGARRVLDGAMDGAGEGVLDASDEQAEGMGSPVASSEASGEQIDVIVQRVHGIPNALGGGG